MCHIDPHWICLAKALRQLLCPYWVLRQLVHLKNHSKVSYEQKLPDPSLWCFSKTNPQTVTKCYTLIRCAWQVHGFVCLEICVCPFSGSCRVSTGSHRVAEPHFGAAISWHDIFVGKFIGKLLRLQMFNYKSLNLQKHLPVDSCYASRIFSSLNFEKRSQVGWRRACDSLSIAVEVGAHLTSPRALIIDWWLNGPRKNMIWPNHLQAPGVSMGIDKDR